jgi:hypothetical protein
VADFGALHFIWSFRLLKALAKPWHALADFGALHFIWSLRLLKALAKLWHALAGQSQPSLACFDRLWHASLNPLWQSCGML